MSLGIVYGGVLIVSLVCGFAGMKKPHNKLNILAGVVMIAGCIYATKQYTWFHILGLVGITLVGLNAFNAIDMILQGKKEEKARVDKIFDVEGEEEERNEQSH